MPEESASDARRGDAQMTVMGTDAPRDHEGESSGGAEQALREAVAEVTTSSPDVGPIDIAGRVPNIHVDHSPDLALGGVDDTVEAESEESDETPVDVSLAPVEHAAPAEATDSATDSALIPAATIPAPDAGSAAVITENVAAAAQTHLVEVVRAPAARAANQIPVVDTGSRESPPVDPADAALVARGLVKVFGGLRAVDGIDLTIPAGSFYGIVGPNGAGKTTTLSMIAGLLRPDAGSVSVCGIDARHDPRAAKRTMGVLPDRFRTFDRLTGHQLLHYYGVLRGLSSSVTESRIADLGRAFDLTAALGRSVSDYSAGMTKKVMLAGALIHSPRVLVLDEPFESVDPVSSAVILDILSSYVQGGGTVILSSHGMDLVERVCSRVAVVVGGRVLAEGNVDDVRGGLTLEQRFVELSGGTGTVEGLEWLHTFSG